MAGEHGACPLSTGVHKYGDVFLRLGISRAGSPCHVRQQSWHGLPARETANPSILPPEAKYVTIFMKPCTKLTLMGRCPRLIWNALGPTEKMEFLISMNDESSQELCVEILTHDVISFTSV